MIRDEELLEKIGAADAPEDEQRLLLEQLQTYIGEAISNTLSEQQLNEYQAIIDDDEDVIDAWLDAHVPDYKNAVLYQEFEQGTEQDPERNSPKKLFASLAWVEVHVPNLQAIIDEVVESFRAGRA